MRILILLAAFILCAAAPASYDAVCPSVCIASDGTSQPGGTVLFRFLWNGQAPYIPRDTAGNALTPTLDSFQTVPAYQPAPPTPTTIDPLDFMARLSPAEQTAITTAAQSNAQVMLFLLKLAGAQTVEVTDPLTQAGVAAMVSAGLLTAPRAAQILNLAQASP